MEKILTINRAIPNNFQFEVMIEGLCDTDVAARFVITNGSTEYLYQCTKLEDNKFQVDFPPLPKEFVNDEYPCRIEVIADGHFFVPVTGLAVVTEGKPEAKVTDIEPVIKSDKKEEEKPEEKKEEKAEEKKEEPEENEEKTKDEKEEETKESADELDEIVRKAAAVVEKTVDPEKDKAARRVLEALRAKKVAEAKRKERERMEEAAAKKKAKEKAILEKQKKNRKIQEIIESTKPRVTVKY